MSTPLHPQEQLLNLLAQEATEGLSAAELEQLQLLLDAQDEMSGDEFDASVAATLLAAQAEPTSRAPAMPVALAARILATAPVQATADKVITLPVRNTSRSSGVEQAGWWAAAACFALAAWGWWPRLMPQPVEPTLPIVAQLTPEQQRNALLSSGHVIQASWSPGNDATGNALMGDVVFDPITQKGYLRFRGIPANDPRLEQYQLWIADSSRSPPEPVDGGVFDTPQTTAVGDVIIPFEAKLPVGKPAAFVVTVEQPGGVVVSKQERVLALAKVTS